MEIIPVIDVKGGVAVAAQGGHREAYQRLQSPLSKGSGDVHTLVDGYLALYPFSAIYIADLDAIQGRGSNAATIEDLPSLYPEIEFWVDSGAKCREDIEVQVRQNGLRAVVGSETDIPASVLARLVHEFGDQLILSLDFKGSEFLGEAGVIASPSIWPDRIIVMTLARVGMNSGPELARLQQIRSEAGHRKVYAAGGVRDLTDLRALSDAGCQGALIATSLHTGKIKTGDLREIAGW